MGTSGNSKVKLYSPYWIDKNIITTFIYVIFNNQPRVERDIASADRESNSSMENTNSRRRQKVKPTHNQTGNFCSSMNSQAQLYLKYFSSGFVK